MNVRIIKPIPRSGESPLLHLEPECERDEKTLETLLQNHESVVLGFGRHADTLRIIHMQLAIED